MKRFKKMQIVGILVFTGLIVSCNDAHQRKEPLPNSKIIVSDEKAREMMLNFTSKTLSQGLTVFSQQLSSSSSSIASDLLSSDVFSVDSTSILFKPSIFASHVTIDRYKNRFNSLISPSATGRIQQSLSSRNQDDPLGIDFSTLFDESFVYSINANGEYVYTLNQNFFCSDLSGAKLSECVALTSVFALHLLVINEEEGQIKFYIKEDQLFTLSFSKTSFELNFSLTGLHGGLKTLAALNDDISDEPLPEVMKGEINLQMHVSSDSIADMSISIPSSIEIYIDENARFSWEASDGVYLSANNEANTLDIDMSFGALLAVFTELDDIYQLVLPAFASNIDMSVVDDTLDFTLTHTGFLEEHNPVQFQLNDDVIFSYGMDELTMISDGVDLTIVGDTQLSFYLNNGDGLFDGFMTNEQTIEMAFLNGLTIREKKTLVESVLEVIDGELSLTFTGDYDVTLSAASGDCIFLSEDRLMAYGVSITECR